jgi:kinesin family protein 11
MKAAFEDLTGGIDAQRDQSQKHRLELQDASRAAVEQNTIISRHMQEEIEEESRQAAEERQRLMFQIASLINAQAKAHESRLNQKTAQLQERMLETNATLENCVARYGHAMDDWDRNDGRLLDAVSASKGVLKAKLDDTWKVSLTICTPVSYD